MAPERHADSALIDEVGPSLVRAQFKLSHQRLHWWRLRGIPANFRLPFAQLAMMHGKQIPQGFLPSLESMAA